MKRIEDPRKWARLAVCAAFYMILIGLGGAILRHAFGVARPGRLLFLPGLAAALVAGWFYTSDRPGNRLAEAGNLAGALTALRLWADLSFGADESGLGRGAYFAAWWVWGTYLGNVLAVLAAGWWSERGRR